jgi:DNA-binding SARP family transcriptional activator
MAEQALRVEALGPLRAWLGDREIDLGPARQRAVFAVLALRAAARRVTRAELVQAVWGDSPPKSAAGSVHTYVSRLRQALNPGRTRWSTDGLLVSDSSGYRLRLEPGALDADAFERRCETARSLGRAGDFAGAVSNLDTALELWRGDALSGVTGPFAEAQRARLAEGRLRALEHRAARVVTLDTRAGLVAELTVLVRENPLRESFWQSLMIALHRRNRTAEALDAFQRAREVLRAELGTAPGPELMAAHHRVLTGSPAHRTREEPPAEVSETTRRVLRWAALLGTEFSVTQLAAVLDKTPSHLLPSFEEALEAGILVEAGPLLSFRTPLVRRALYDDIAAEARGDWHRHAAKVLTAMGARTEQIARHLAAASASGSPQGHLGRGERHQGGLEVMSYSALRQRVGEGFRRPATPIPRAGPARPARDPGRRCREVAAARPPPASSLSAVA